MTCVLDTSVLIGAETGRLRPEQLPGEACLSVISLEELLLGVHSAPPGLKPVRHATYIAAVAAYTIANVTLEVAELSADIRAEGRTRGIRYSPFDSLIAGTARSRGVPLVTQDKRMIGMVGVDVQLV